MRSHNISLPRTNSMGDGAPSFTVSDDDFLRLMHDTSLELPLLERGPSATSIKLEVSDIHNHSKADHFEVPQPVSSSSSSSPPSAVQQPPRRNMMALQATLEVDDDLEDDSESVASEESSQQEEQQQRQMSEASKTLLQLIEVAQERFENTKDKQTCHFCGRHRPEEERIYCQNPHCFLQGAKRKYLCTSCVESQEQYFGRETFLNIYGDVESDEWFCPCCIIWEDGFLPYPGICCCSFRRHDMSCPWHKEKGDCKKNPHCKPYRQKNTKEERMLPLPMSLDRIRVGSRPFFRKMIHSGEKVQFNTKDKKKIKQEKGKATKKKQQKPQMEEMKEAANTDEIDEARKREIVQESLREFARYSSGTHWLGLMLNQFGLANNFVRAASIVRTNSISAANGDASTSIPPTANTENDADADAYASVDEASLEKPSHNGRTKRRAAAAVEDNRPVKGRKGGTRTRSHHMKLRTKTM